MKYDVIIIGGGAVGCACARELSKYQLRIALLEKEPDVACGTSGRNSAVVHAGFNNKPGTLMAKLCVEGNKGFDKVCKELDVPYKRTGKYLVAFNDNDVRTLEELVEKGKCNGCTGLSLISGDEMRKSEPNISGVMAMYSADTAIFNPFLYTIALAENAHDNGVEFFFESELISAERGTESFHLKTRDSKTFESRYVINCAGLFSAKVSRIFGADYYHIYPCRGEYFILDKDALNIIHTPVYPAPQKGIGGLGVHLTPTIDGNIIIGPSAEYIDDKEDYSTTKVVMEKLLGEAQQLLPQISSKLVIGSYAGLRSKQAPKEEGGFRDFVIKEEERIPGLINLIGIESPGLTASIPIANYVIDIIKKKETLFYNSHFVPNRKRMIRFRELTDNEKTELISKNPEYGEVVCRCEQVTKGEIIDAINRILGPITISGIKNRTRITTGRCQGGYCLNKTIKTLLDEYSMEPEEIRYREKGTELFWGNLK